MSFHVDDKVVVLDKKNQSLSEGHKGIVVDLKWNLILIRFDDGECDWIEIKRVHKHR